MNLKICSFNINGVRARPHQLEFIANGTAPQIIGLQETKVANDMYPLHDSKKLGYEAVINGQKAHHGVATLYKPSDELQLIESHSGIPGLPDEKHPRMIRSLFRWHDHDIWVFNGYFPQGATRDHPEKFPYKQLFYKKLTEFINSEHSPSDNLAIIGDLNISPEDTDIGIGEENRKRWLKQGKCSFLPEERDMLATLTNFGLTDTWRHLNPDRNDLFSWFDYRSRGFEDNPKRGLRIDQIWCTAPLLAKVTAADIDYQCRGQEKPSDHAPIWAEFDL